MALGVSYRGSKVWKCKRNSKATELEECVAATCLITTVYRHGSLYNISISCIAESDLPEKQVSLEFFLSSLPTLSRP
jgi:hypothetical protein